MATHESSPFAPLPAEAVLLEYQALTRTYRVWILLLFLLVAALFGGVAWLFFRTPQWEALLLSLGLAFFMLLALPRTRYAYRFTQTGVEQAELGGDVFDLQSVIPLLGGIGILGVMVLSLGARFLGYIAIACGVLLFAARRLFPRRKNLPVISLSWEAVQAVTVERRRHVFMLRPGRESGPDAADLLVACRPGELERMLELVRVHAPQAAISEGVLIH